MTSLDKYATFAQRAAEKMVERLEHGAAKFGTDWDTSLYTDAHNEERLRRAVDHLVAARANSDDPEEWRKRAADVANQAFMYAAPDRLRTIMTPDEHRAALAESQP